MSSRIDVVKSTRRDWASTPCYTSFTLKFHTFPRNIMALSRQEYNSLSTPYSHSIYGIHVEIDAFLDRHHKAIWSLQLGGVLRELDITLNHLYDTIRLPDDIPGLDDISPVKRINQINKLSSEAIRTAYDYSKSNTGRTLRDFHKLCIHLDTSHLILKPYQDLHQKIIMFGDALDLFKRYIQQQRRLKEKLNSDIEKAIEKCCMAGTKRRRE